MSEMVERVARAIFEARSQSHTTWEQCDWGYRTMKLKEARAAIEAMREPTTEMVRRAMDPYVYGNDEKMNDAFRITITSYWRDMIDEALK